MNRAVHLDEIPYRPDSCELFEPLRELPGAAFLDSSYPHASSGRFDILSALPAATLAAPAPGAGAGECEQFFRDLAAFHGEHFAGIQPVSHDIPFCGGVLGCIGYDSGNGLHGVRHSQDRPADALPATLGAYHWAVVQDHLLRRSMLVAQPGVTARQRKELLAMLADSRKLAGEPFRLRGGFSANFTAAEYAAAFERIQAYIQAGDCYQVNLAQRFSSGYRGDPWEGYRVLREVAAAPFSAYLALDNGGAVMSLSPERFIALHGQHVETSPIKGTRPRHADSAMDRAAAQELRGADKDRAENLMIVDLLRNDLGRSCIPGSIHVDRLFELQSFPTVHHLVSTISGELRSDCGAVQLLANSFPGGSITGAPKRRAMQIIAELEPHPRQVYCGSVLYISADGRMDSNIAIRTLLCRDKKVHCWAGGGIVADSNCEQEYQETFDKVGRFLEVLERLGGNRGFPVQ
jgi:para-aminobenzoate synthetase component 1